MHLNGPLQHSLLLNLKYINYINIIIGRDFT